MGQPRSRAGGERVFSHPFMSVRRDRFVDDATGLEREAFLVEMPDWVNVVAVDDSRNLLLVRQFRFGTRTETAEIPGGAIDPGESPLDAAKRELLEETGYAATSWREIGVVEPNPAIQGNVCTTFLAHGLERTTDHDADEIDGVEFMAFEEVRGRIRDGEIRHALVIAAIHFAVEAFATGEPPAGRAGRGEGSEGAGL